MGEVCFQRINQTQKSPLQKATPVLTIKNNNIIQVKDVTTTLPQHQLDTELNPDQNIIHNLGHIELTQVTLGESKAMQTPKNIFRNYPKLQNRQFGKTVSALPKITIKKNKIKRLEPLVFEDKVLNPNILVLKNEDFINPITIAVSKAENKIVYRQSCELHNAINENAIDADPNIMMTDNEVLSSDITVSTVPQSSVRTKTPKIIINKNKLMKIGSLTDNIYHHTINSNEIKIKHNIQHNTNSDSNTLIEIMKENRNIKATVSTHFDTSNSFHKEYEKCLITNYKEIRHGEYSIKAEEQVKGEQNLTEVPVYYNNVDYNADMNVKDEQEQDPTEIGLCNVDDNSEMNEEEVKEEEHSTEIGVSNNVDYNADIIEEEVKEEQHPTEVDAYYNVDVNEVEVNLEQNIVLKWDDNDTRSNHTDENNYDNELTEQDESTEEVNEVVVEENTTVEGKEVLNDGLKRLTVVSPGATFTLMIRPVSRNESKDLLERLQGQNIQIPKYFTENYSQDKPPFICHFCNRQFKALRHLKTHLKRHNADGSWIIDLSKPSEYSKTLQTDEKNFACNMCEKRFRTPQYLQIHYRTHTNERPYKCPTCPKAFKIRVALNRHNRVHTGYKPYTCTHCDKSFSQSNSAKLHIRTVHMGMPAPYRSKRRKKSVVIAPHEE